MAEWSDQAVDTIERVVVAIRDRAVVPTERASRMIVFGLFVGILAVTAFVLVLVAIAYLVSIRLRGSGLVFGGESAAWTMANRIAASVRANDNTIMRNLFITPEAWWKREMAHCILIQLCTLLYRLLYRLLCSDNARQRPSKQPGEKSNKLLTLPTIVYSTASCQVLHARTEIGRASCRERV